MRLLMIQGGFGAGGAEKIMAQLARHRRDEGDEVNVAAMYMPPNGPFFPYSDDIELTVLAENASRNYLLHPRRFLAIRRHIRATKPDLIVSFLTKVNCLTMMAAKGTGIPVVISERNNPRLQSRFWARLQNTLGPSAGVVVMQTGACRDDLPPGLRERAIIIPNVCSAVPFKRQPAQPGHCRFIAVGRLDRQKGFDILIRAFALLPPRPVVHLTIYGEGPERAALEKLVADLGMTDHISLPGLVTSPKEWLQAGDCLVVSSRFEGFSNVVAEATSSGLPIVSFDCPYGPSEMVRNGQNGLLIPPNDMAALVGAMATIANDPELRDKLGSQAHLMAAHLHPDRVMTLWDTVIAQGLASKPARNHGRKEKAMLQTKGISSTESR